MLSYLEGLFGIGKFGWGVILAIVFSAITGSLIRGNCITHVENYEVGYKWDAMSGTITKLPRAGYFVYPPVVVAVHTVETRPMQVCISANERTLNCKLVRFNPEGLDLFISWHGRADYADNGKEVKGGLDDILMSYAYEDAGRTYPFLDVIREMKTEDLEKSASAAVPATVAPAAQQ